MKKRHIRIKDIAGMLNISVSTVSRALRDAYDVNPETRKKVLEVVEQLNYKPNLNAAALASGSTRNIGVIIPFITNYYFSTVISGIQEVAYNNGFNIVLLITNDSAERELNMIRSLSITSLDGLLISISSDSVRSNHFRELADEGIPIVFFDRVPKDIEATKVLQDDFDGAFKATEHLITNGYTRIAHIAGPEHLSFTQNRLQGYLEALKKYTVPVREEWIIYSGFSMQSGKEDTDRLLECEQIPDAVFAVNDRKAVGAIIALKEKKIRVGKDIGVVGFTNDPISTIIEPSLTTIEEPAFDIGKKSCELLIKHITNKHFLPKEIILAGTLIIRDSSRKYDTL
ncbi:MAG: LacI family DNA-binding transcriptional regulator [Mangrovibacterium sp.]